MKAWKQRVFSASDSLFNAAGCERCGSTHLFQDTGLCEPCINATVESQPEMREIRLTGRYDSSLGKEEHT